jgi:phospholipid/cholesterol/gamma-HCH transport system permease protein
MKSFYQLTSFFAGLNDLNKRLFKELFTGPFYFGLLSEQIYHIGVRSLPIVLIVALSTGMVMALQFGFGLEKFGGKFYVPKVVSLSISRELGPVFTALMMAARVSSGIASEIASMSVTQQIDAIRALGTSPIKRIILPRILACIITIPLLSSFAVVIGVTGGLIVGYSELQLDPLFYIQKIFDTVVIADYLSGFFKTYFFAYFIGIVSCYIGLNVSGGTQGVGKATTNAVVISTVFIVISDFFLTKLSIIIESLV